MCRGGCGNGRLNDQRERRRIEIETSEKIIV